MRQLWRRLLTLWRRAAFCRRGVHRDTVEVFGGCALQLRCVDCGKRDVKGWIVPKHAHHHPWEHDDA